MEINWLVSIWWGTLAVNGFSHLTKMQIQIVYSINVEKTCKKSTEDFLLNVESIGNEVRTSFIQKCVENPNRFDERIKKDKIHNFATESVEAVENYWSNNDKIFVWFNAAFVNTTTGRYGWRFKIPTYNCFALFKTYRWFS